ncbi:MAG: hypothetical protein JXA04_06545 [Gammaproteobacteria bacterium]|nr:hypothetical protein [Gammaproteobacteria bacterium]
MRTIFLSGLLMVAADCLAGGTATGKVIEIRAATNTPAVLFMVDAELTDTPKCNEWEMLAIDLSKIGGDAMLQLVKLAKEHAYTIEVTGLGTCSVHWKSEDVKEITIR